MSLESFFGLEDGESQGSAEAAEKFREQMRKNAKALKAITAHQTKQKQQEDKLAKLLVKWLSNAQKSDFVFLVVKLLQENIPGAFVLAVLSITSEELKEEMSKMLENTALPEADRNDFLVDAKLPEAQALPENLRKDLNAWGENILRAGLLLPGKTLKTVLTPEQKLKSIVLDVLIFALEEYFEQHGSAYDDKAVEQFALISIQTVLIKLKRIHDEKTDAEIIESNEVDLVE